MIRDLINKLIDKVNGGMFLVIGLSVGMALGAGTASALSNPETCAVSDVRFDVTQIVGGSPTTVTADSLECAGIFQGNLNETEEAPELNRLFGSYGTWTWIDKYETDLGTNQNGKITASKTNPGNYYIANVQNFDPLAVLIKGNNYFSIYVIGGLAEGGTWSTISFPVQNAPELSHISLLGVAAVPLPAGLGLLGAMMLGFGGVAWIRRRRGDG